MVSSALKPLTASIAATISDYRQYEAFPPTIDQAHVERWADQFKPAVQPLLLSEIDAVLKKTYYTRDEVVQFLSKLCNNTKIAGPNPAAFWPTVNFLDVQRGGQSQAEMLELFGECLQSTHGIDIQKCGSPTGPYLYLDDAVFSGNRVLNDLRAFAKTAPAKVDLHIVVIALHTGGQWYADSNLQKAFQDEQKTLSVTWWRTADFENRKTNQDVDVLRPTQLPPSQAMANYVATMTPYAPVLRTGTHLGSLGTFATVAGRELLEQEFVEAGLAIRAMCPNLKENHRPLGYTPLKGLGFGSTIVTFRNCPNSCPLAFWVSHPWYPLFPRKNN